ncbi:MAG: hypothetical protein L3K10_07480 [Thermoplasmata archaeon]|nr:hypothetical protein [Thermoplasmata archaeon]
MTEVPLLVTRCGSCTLRYLPRAGPCPRCGASNPLPFSVPPLGSVLAATELTSPAAGWPAPHRLALVELAESVRVLAIVEGELPSIGSTVEVVHDVETYHTRPPH